MPLKDFVFQTLCVGQNGKRDHEEEGGRENKEKLDLGGGNLTETHFNALKSSLPFILQGVCQ